MARRHIHQHRVQQGLHRFRDHGLQQVRFDRQRHAQHFAYQASMSSGSEYDGSRLYLTLRGLHGRGAIACGVQPCHFAVFDDVDTQCRGCPGITPSHGVVSNSATAVLYQCPHDWKAAATARCQSGHKFFQGGPVHQLRINASKP